MNYRKVKKNPTTIVDEMGFLPAINVNEQIYINSLRFYKTPADGYFVRFKILLTIGEHKFNLINNFLRLNDLGKYVWHATTEVDRHTYELILNSLTQQEWVRTVGRGKARTPYQTVVEEKDILEMIKQ